MSFLAYIPRMPEPFRLSGTLDATDRHVGLQLQGWRGFAVATVAILLIAIPLRAWAPGPSRPDKGVTDMVRHTPPSMRVMSIDQLWRLIREAEDELEARGEKNGLKTYHASRVSELVDEVKAATPRGLDNEPVEAPPPPPALRLVAKPEEVDP